MRLSAGIFYESANQKLIVKLNGWEEIVQEACTMYGMDEIEHLLAMLRGPGDKTPVNQWANFIKDRFILWEGCICSKRRTVLLSPLISGSGLRGKPGAEGNNRILGYQDFTPEDIRIASMNLFPSRIITGDGWENFKTNQDMSEA